MIKIEIKNRWTGSVIFTYEKENATIKDVVLQALKESANLYGADLYGADLYGADLRDAKNKEEAYIPIFCKWSHSIKGDDIQISCKLKSIEEWDLFFNSEETYSTERNTEDFKQIQAVYLAYKAYLTHLKS